MRPIDADALLEQIGIDSDGSPGYYGDTWQFIKTIENAPTLDMTSEWIPCSEKLPEGSDGISECEMVLMTLSVGDVSCGWINGDTAYVLINNPVYDQIVIADRKDVLAWMPLPKPWKGAEDE